jgi:hypothetical protein
MEELLRNRYEKFRKLGKFSEVVAAAAETPAANSQ